VSLLSLAFKRKVFFMDFSEAYSYWTLVRLYLMLLHPLFQLKYRMDPHVSRYYRFLYLFTRLSCSYALTFFLMRRLSTNGGGDSALVIYVFAGSLLYLPLPTLLYAPIRSAYYLLKAAEDKQSEGGDEIGGDRITDVQLDTSIPIKLLFVLNATKLERIIEEKAGKLKYCTGDPAAVGEKLLELDQEFQESTAKESRVK
jgi:hypothetical protein